MVDISAALSRLRIPTLVIHGRGDQVVPVDEGRRLASGIAGATYLELDSRNHVLLEAESAWLQFQESVRRFLHADESGVGTAFSALSSREREVLSGMSEGLSNARIAESLGISEKTVRNHASNLFDKLGIRSRAEAIVLARDHGFRRDRS